MQVVMTQIQHLAGVVGQLAQQQQHQQMQWQQQGAQQNPAVSPPGLGPHVKAIDTRFVKIPFFPGEGKHYEDWSFAKRAMRAANRTTYEILATVEKVGLEIGDEELAEQFAEEDVQGHSAVDLRRVVPVCGRGSSAAGPDGGRHGRVPSLEQTVPEVRPEDDGEGNPDGGPGNEPSESQNVGQVTNPPKVKELRDVERELMKWEEKAKALTKEFGETFSDTVKVWIVVSIMPQAVQELVYQSIGDKLDYDEVTAKIRSVVSNEVAMNGRPPLQWTSRKIDHECESENLEDDVAAGELVDPVPRLWRLGPPSSRVPVRRERREGEAKLGARDLVKRARERACPPRADRRATAGA